MTSNTSIEERLAAVEKAIAELQKQAIAPQSTNWLQQITGSFRDEPAFEEVLAYGRSIRQGDGTQAARADYEAGDYTMSDQYAAQRESRSA